MQISNVTLSDDIHNNIAFTYGEIVKFWCENQG